MRKQTKGFTLIELIAVIVVLAIILAIAVPAVSNIIRTSTMKAFESDAKMVLNAIRLKEIETDSLNPEDINEANIVSRLGLSNDNYYDLKIKIYNNEKYIAVIGQGKWAGFSACGTFRNIRVNEGECTNDFEIPVIMLNGLPTIDIQIGSTYIDEGATASDDVDGDITDKIVITGTVNPNIVGTYILDYDVSDSSGKAAVTVTRTINVIDTNNPIVIFGTNGNSEWAKNRSTTVTASDIGGIDDTSLKYLWNTSIEEPSEEDFHTTFTNGGSLDSPSGVTGGYYLWVIAKDNQGNTTITRTDVFNLDNTVPSVPTSEVRYGSSSGIIRTNNDSSWTNQTLWWGNFSATDDNSGIASYQYSTGCSGSSSGTLETSYTYSNNNYDYCTRSIDNAGNVSAWSSVTYIRADNTAPSTPTVNLNGYTSGAWNRSNITFSINSTDTTSGVQKYQYSRNAGSTWADTDGGWTYSWDVNESLIFRAIDNTGNISNNTSTYIFRRDVTPPVITMNGDSTVTAMKGITYNDAGATAVEETSGLASAIQVTSDINVNAVGTYYVWYNVTDNAGNVATQVTRTVNVVSPPVYTFTAAGATGAVGPTQAQLNSAYSSTNLAGTVTSSAGIQLWTVPATGSYTIETRGAQGTAYGAIMKGTFTLNAGTQLKILVGQQSGGGSFVTLSDNTPLIIAGGGGSGSGCGTTGQGQTTTNGGAGTGTYAVAGGTNGNGGPANGNGGASGGGLLTNGGNGMAYSGGFQGMITTYPMGGSAFVNGGSNEMPWQQNTSYSVGGFGGAGGGCGYWSAGGSGGGYSGGGGAGWNGCGGGGGSYNSGTNQVNTAGANTGAGTVIITRVQ